MKIQICAAAALAVAMGIAGAASAQDAAPAETAPTLAVDPSAAGPAAAPAVAPADPESRCELHVWPTHNYLGINTGLLSGFGALGAVADMAAHKDRVKSVVELMEDYLGPEQQLAELQRVGIAETLKLKGYRIVVEMPTPFNGDIKKDPAVKARVEAMKARLKAGQRLTDSRNPCYAELITTLIFYHKAMMYGSNLFTGWTFRDFGDKPGVLRTSTGAVKNPLGAFPAKAPEGVDAAKAELRDAFGKDFVEYVEKKVKA